MRLLITLTCLLFPAAVLAQTTGHATAFAREGIDAPSPTSPPVEIRITQGVAFPGSARAYEYILLPNGVEVDDLAQAINPAAVLKARADAQGATYVMGSVHAEGASASASFVQDAQYAGYIGSGYLYGARVEKGRLRGQLRIRDEESPARIDATFDAPLIVPAKGTPLPADGGAPWREFERLRDALRTGKEAAIRPLLAASILRELPADQPFEKSLPQLRKAFPDQGRFLSGATTALDARLILLDESSGKPVRCVMTLLPENGTWRVSQLSFRHGDKPVDPPMPPGFSEVPVDEG
jgi:hypothetical protein